MTTMFDSAIREARRDNFGAFGKSGCWKGQKLDGSWGRIISARTSKGKAYARFLADGNEYEISGLSCLM